MGLRATVRKAAMTAVRAIGDISEAIVYVQVTPGVYNTTTGQTADVPTNYPLTVPLVRLSESEVAWFPGSDKVQRLLIPDLMLEGVVLSRNDYVTVGGVRWEIKRTRHPLGLIIVYVESP